jgi:hypothetical protein
MICLGIVFLMSLVLGVHGASQSYEFKVFVLPGKFGIIGSLNLLSVFPLPLGFQWIFI